MTYNVFSGTLNLTQSIISFLLAYYYYCCCCYGKHHHPRQLLSVAGFVEESAFLGEYHTVDQTGRSGMYSICE